MGKLTQKMAKSDPKMDQKWAWSAHFGAAQFTSIYCKAVPKNVKIITLGPFVSPKWWTSTYQMVQFVKLDHQICFSLITPVNWQGLHTADALAAENLSNKNWTRVGKIWPSFGKKHIFPSTTLMLRPPFGSHKWVMHTPNHGRQLNVQTIAHFGQNGMKSSQNGQKSDTNLTILAIIWWPKWAMVFSISLSHGQIHIGDGLPCPSMIIAKMGQINGHDLACITSNQNWDLV